ncbi:hypothetical protein Q3O60_15770 [Alkalimonas collagenimarina]|uniref:Uncharacterized protein n=1 Tax=Alkalimonas collagenimarina TaxID=400390 RepID=A0ABT9H2U7_9GAMM|nr:hypothetical protein [Alkalimonas collagenimarina]MDP4537644.1 hypothetical protein [Alkalimonas collagenimarina]
MEQLLPELLSKHWFIAIILIAVSIVSALLKVFTGIISTHEEMFLKRDLKRLLLLKDSVVGGSDISGFVEKRIEEEAFTLASGMRTSREKSKMLMKLYQQDFLSKRQLKHIANNLIPAGDKIQFELGGFEKSEIIYSFWASIVLFLIGFSGLLPLIGKPSLVTALFAIVTFGTAILLTIFVGGSYQKYKTLHFVWLKLKESEQVANPELNVRTRFVYTPDK